jgi:hypothetical protein
MALERDQEQEIGTNAARDWDVYAEKVEPEPEPEPEDEGARAMPLVRKEDDDDGDWG